MEIGNLIEDIINIPTKFHELRDVSFYTLLKNSGYFVLYNQISEEKIFEQLSKHPEWVNQWIQYSEDQRVSSCWYFIPGKKGKYIIDHYPQIEKSKAREFSSIKEACAYFIKLKIEETRKL
jgi:hypothetical protein